MRVPCYPTVEAALLGHGVHALRRYSVVYEGYVYKNLKPSDLQLLEGIGLLITNFELTVFETDLTIACQGVEF